MSPTEKQIQSAVAKHFPDDEYLKEPRKKIAVAWTGGYDSTALILKYLSEDYDVTAVSAILENNEFQSASEQRARDAIMAYFDNSYKYRGRVKCISFKIPTIPQSRQMEIIQPYLWLTNLPLHCNNEKIALGYVSGDDFWHFKEYAKKSQEALNGFARDKFEFEFPLEYYDKEGLTGFYRENKEIVPFLSVCENGTHWMACDGYCKKCPKMRWLWAQIMGMKLVERQTFEMINEIKQAEEDAKPKLFDKHLHVNDQEKLMVR